MFDFLYKINRNKYNDYKAKLAEIFQKQEKIRIDGAQRTLKIAAKTTAQLKQEKARIEKETQAAIEKVITDVLGDTTGVNWSWDAKAIADKLKDNTKKAFAKYKEMQLYVKFVDRIDARQSLSAAAFNKFLSEYKNYKYYGETENASLAEMFARFDAFLRNIKAVVKIMKR